MKEHFLMMAAYNKWANTRIYDAAAELTGEEYGRDVGAFFKSMMGTLNHILVADRIWMRRFTGEGDAPARLDTVLHPALPALRLLRETEDRRIIDWIEGLEQTALEGRITYTTATDMRRVSQRLAPALSHFFNHQTHHRGHAHMILSVLGKEPPSLDIIYFQRTPDGSRYS
ncbi:MAG TPA: DinB family protein [Rhizobiaceae bacterium]|nr:DinB family protein [Rhizobiaceae bacterium]